MEIEIALQPLVDETTLHKRIAELGAEITRDYRDKDPLVVVGVLKGSFLFMSDLVRRIDIPLTCDFLRVSSYGDREETSGIVRFDLDVSQPVTGKHVLLIEDIIDTGLTMHYLLENFRTRRPASLKVCSLLNKVSRREKIFHVDYVGFEIPNEFVVGYGLDYKGRYRNLPFVGSVKKG